MSNEENKMKERKLTELDKKKTENKKLGPLINI